MIFFPNCDPWALRKYSHKSTQSSSYQYITISECHTDDKYWCPENKIPTVALTGAPWETEVALCSPEGPTLAPDGGQLGPQG